MSPLVPRSAIFPLPSLRFASQPLTRSLVALPSPFLVRFEVKPQLQLIKDGPPRQVRVPWHGPAVEARHRRSLGKPGNLIHEYYGNCWATNLALMPCQGSLSNGFHSVFRQCFELQFNPDLLGASVNLIRALPQA